MHEVLEQMASAKSYVIQGKNGNHYGDIRNGDNGKHYGNGIGGGRFVNGSTDGECDACE